MTKSPKKNVALNEKPQITQKPVKGVMNGTKRNKSESKIIKKIAVSPETSGDSKQSMMLALLQRSGGATVDELSSATGWQRHSVRGAISGVLKKRLGLAIISDAEERGRVYRIKGAASRL